LLAIARLALSDETTVCGAELLVNFSAIEAVRLGRSSITLYKFHQARIDTSSGEAIRLREG